MGHVWENKGDKLSVLLGEEDNLENAGLDSDSILKWTFKEQRDLTWTRFIWLRTEVIDGLS